MAYNQRGDTLVEVLMAIVVLSLVIIGAVTLMNRGLIAAQNAVEHSETRQEVNSQLELIRYLRDAYATNSGSAEADVWRSVVSISNTSPTDYSSGCSVSGAKAGTAFYLRKTGSTVERVSFDPNQKPATYATAGRGMWIESRVSNGYSPAYVDFVIRACWAGTGGGASQQTVTAQRFYDPSR